MLLALRFFGHEHEKKADFALPKTQLQFFRTFTNTSKKKY